MTHKLFLITRRGFRPQRLSILATAFHRLIINRIILERAYDLLPPGLGATELIKLVLQLVHFRF